MKTVNPTLTVLLQIKQSAINLTFPSVIGVFYNESVLNDSGSMW